MEKTEWQRRLERDPELRERCRVHSFKRYHALKDDPDFKRYQRAKTSRRYFRVKSGLKIERVPLSIEHVRAIRAAKCARRHAAKMQATPAWADLDKIKAFYVQAARLTQETGVRHEVDHIIPLQGELVCGLHIETNLQILTKAENCRKHNRVQ